MSDEDADKPSPAYEVGYKRPPSNRQFKKGKSGNPRGRPKGARDFATLVRENLAKHIPVKADGKVRTLPIGEAILMRLLREAASGNPRAAEHAIKLMERHAPAEEPKKPEEFPGLASMTEDELNDLGRLAAKARGESAEWEEGLEQEKREQEKARAERERIFGKTDLLPDGS